MKVKYERPLRIAVSIAESNVIEMQRQMNKIEELAYQNKSNIEYLIELRIDALNSITENSLNILLEQNKIPKIVTIRPKDMRGGFIGSNTDRLQYFNRAIHLCAEYIDIEIEHYADLNSIDKKQTKLILSHHNYERTVDLPELENIYREIADKNPDIIKIATMAKKYEDSWNMLNLILKHPRDELIGICMNDLGRSTREWGPLFGGFLTFAALSKDKITGPGQYTVEELVLLWKMHRLI